VGPNGVVPSSVKIGPYEIETEVARGSFGVVYRARDERDRETVALKLLQARRAVDDASRKRFELEVEALTKLDHPGVIEILGAGEHEGAPYLVLEFVLGSSLQDRIDAEGPLPIDDAVALASQLAKALDYVHGEGILHRDLKPENVLITHDGEPKLTDFGLALDAEIGDADRLTEQGMFIGSPGYWAPEQAEGELELFGPQSDVYGLGAVLYACLTARPPIQAKTLREYLTSIAAKGIESPRRLRDDVPDWLSNLCMKCLSTGIAARPESAGEVARLLEAGEAGAQELERERSGRRAKVEAKAKRASQRAAKAEAKRASRRAKAEAKQAKRASRRAKVEAAPAKADGAPAPRRGGGRALGLLAALAILGGAGAAGWHYREPLRTWVEELRAAAPAEAAKPALELSLSSPTPDAEILGTGTLELEGSATPGAKVTVAGRELVVAADGAFAAKVELETGEHSFAVAARDDAGNTAHTDVSVHYTVVPAWYLELPPAERASLPLPGGVEFGEGAGDYLHLHDGTVLRWVPFESGEGLFVGKRLVSKAQFAAFLQATGQAVSEEEPVDAAQVEVTWTEAQAYCAWARLRLPSEAEWERAAQRGYGSVDLGALFEWTATAEGETRHVARRDSSVSKARATYLDRHSAIDLGFRAVLDVK